MQRIVTSVKLDERRVRWRTRIESDPCALDMIEPVKYTLMTNFADNPMLLHCGLTPFQTLKMYHNGNCWIVEAEAIVESPYAKESANTASSQERGTAG